MDSVEQVVTIPPAQPGFDAETTVPDIVEQSDLPTAPGQGRLCAVLFPKYDPECDLTFDIALDDQGQLETDESLKSPNLKTERGRVRTQVNMGGNRIAIAGQPIRFDASFSQGDNDRVKGKASWKFGDGHQGNGMTVEHTYHDPGSHQVECEIDDRTGRRHVRVLSELGESDLEIIAIGSWGGSTATGWSLQATVATPASLSRMQGIGFYIADGMQTRWRSRYERQLRKLNRRWAWSDNKPEEPRWVTQWVETTTPIPGLDSAGGGAPSWQVPYWDETVGVSVVSGDGLYDEHYVQWGNHYGIPPALLKAWCSVMSNENAQLVNVGVGLAQLTPDQTGKTEAELLDPDTNVIALCDLLMDAYASCGSWLDAACQLLTGNCAPDGTVVNGWEDWAFVREISDRWVGFDVPTGDSTLDDGEMVFCGYITEATLVRSGDGLHQYQITCVDAAQTLNMVLMRRQDYFEDGMTPSEGGTIMDAPMKSASIMQHLLGVHTDYSGKHDVVTDWSGPRYGCTSAVEGTVLQALRNIADPEFAVIFGDRQGRLRHEQRHSFRLPGWAKQARRYAITISPRQVIRAVVTNHIQGDQTIWVRLCGFTCPGGHCTSCKLCTDYPCDGPADGPSGTWAVREGLPIDDWTTLCQLSASYWANENRNYDLTLTLPWRHDLDLQDLIRIPLVDPSGQFDWSGSELATEHPLFVVTAISHEFDVTAQSWMTTVTTEQLTSQKACDCKRPVCHETCFRSGNVDVPYGPVPTVPPTDALEPPPYGNQDKTDQDKTPTVLTWDSTPADVFEPPVERTEEGKSTSAPDVTQVWETIRPGGTAEADDPLADGQIARSWRNVELGLKTFGTGLMERWYRRADPSDTDEFGCFRKCEEKAYQWLEQRNRDEIYWPVASVEPVNQTMQPFHVRNDHALLRKGMVEVADSVAGLITPGTFQTVNWYTFFPVGPLGGYATLKLGLRPKLLHEWSGTRFAIAIGAFRSYTDNFTLFRYFKTPPVEVNDPLLGGLKTPFGQDRYNGKDYADYEAEEDFRWFWHSVHDVRTVIPYGQIEGGVIDIEIDLPLRAQTNPPSYYGGAEWMVALVPLGPLGAYEITSETNKVVRPDGISYKVDNGLIFHNLLVEPNGTSTPMLRSGGKICVDAYGITYQWSAADERCGVYYRGTLSDVLGDITDSVNQGNSGVVDWCDPRRAPTRPACGYNVCFDHMPCYPTHRWTAFSNTPDPTCHGLSTVPAQRAPIDRPVCPQSCEQVEFTTGCIDNRARYFATEMVMAVTHELQDYRYAETVREIDVRTVEATEPVAEVVPPYDPTPTTDPVDPRGGRRPAAPCGNWPTSRAINERIRLSEQANGRKSALSQTGYGFIELAKQYGVNPGVVVAILQRESQLGTDGGVLATQANNFGGITGEGTCGSISYAGKTFAKWCNPLESVEKVFRLLSGAPYTETNGSLSAVMGLYSPPSENDWQAMWDAFDAIGTQLGIRLEAATNVWQDATCQPMQQTEQMLRLERSLRQAKATVTQRPYESYSHEMCDCYDFGVPVGTDIYPLVGGQVVWAGPTSDAYGPIKVVVRAYGPANPDETVPYADYVYAHLSEVTVAGNDIVDTETLIGRSGSAGTGPHLHLQLDGGAERNRGISLYEQMQKVGFNVAAFPYA